MYDELYKTWKQELDGNSGAKLGHGKRRNLGQNDVLIHFLEGHVESDLH